MTMSMVTPSLPALTVAQYAEMELRGLASLSNRIIEAASAVAFSEVGYPIRVQSDSELWRYADCMHEGMTRAYFAKLDGLSESEFAGLGKIVATVRSLTDSYGHKVTAAAPVLRALWTYRHLPQGSICEIGPGSGYLGAWAILDNRSYRSVEISQAFHLWQNALFGALGKDGQIPWWDWYGGQAAPGGTIVCNNALNEFHPTALRFLARKAEEYAIPIAVDGFGSEILRSTRKTIKEFRGWRALRREGISLFLPPGATAPVFRASVSKPRTWEDAEQVFGGVPVSDDERFLNYCRPERSAGRKLLKKIALSVIPGLSR